jgi:hypothetical protein
MAFSAAVGIDMKNRKAGKASRAKGRMAMANEKNRKNNIPLR